MTYAIEYFFPSYEVKKKVSYRLGHIFKHNKLGDVDKHSCISRCWGRVSLSSILGHGQVGLHLVGRFVWFVQW